MNSAVNTQVEFRSKKFPPYDGEQEEINPGLWGKRLAEYLVQNLNAKGVQTEGIIVEDWGCLIPIKNDAFSLSIACGHQYGDDDEFLVFVEPHKPVIRKWFKKINTTEQVGRVCEVLSGILSSDPDIRDIHWQRDDLQ